MYDQFVWLEYSVDSDALLGHFFIVSTPDPTFTSVALVSRTGSMPLVKMVFRVGMQLVMSMWKEFKVRSKTGESFGCQLDQMGSKVIADNRKYVSVVM